MPKQTDQATDQATDNADALNEEPISVRILVDVAINGYSLKCGQPVLATAAQAKELEALGAGDTDPAAVDYAVSQLAEGAAPLNISLPFE